MGVLGNFVKRTINVPDDWNAEDNVNPAKNRTLGGATDHGVPPLRICRERGPNERVPLPGGDTKLCRNRLQKRPGTFALHTLREPRNPLAA